MFPKAEFPLTVDQLKVTVGSRFDSTVILYNEEITGFANFYEVKEKEFCSIGNVIVHPDFRHKGIGEFLITTMEHIGAEKYQVHESHLSCFNTNTKGILLYSKLGYQPYEIEKWLNKENGLLALIKLKRKV
ncbi:MAG: GNAT family N-acetyltransferase [Bacteroidales bacterium]|nr:GNAT family N-acetyltransferase [Bacteroidales bacterium]